MSKVQNLAGITPNIPFTEFDFYKLYRETFEKTEFGRIKRLLPLHEMAENLGLVRKSMRPKLGRKSYFTPEGKVALMFLEMYTQLSFPKLMEQLNGNIHFQIFCDIAIDPMHPLTNYKLLDDIAMEIRRIERENEGTEKLLTTREKNDIAIITTMFRQQKNHFQSKNCRESIPNGIVSISRPYVRPIVRARKSRAWSSERSATT